MSEPASESDPQASRISENHTAHELSPEQLRWHCDMSLLDFETTESIDTSDKIVGQPTAYEALKFGLQCMARGQNVYVRGARGTGRLDMVHQILKSLAPKTDRKRDFCYVLNFQQPDHPVLLTFPPGKAPDFRRQLLRLIDFIEGEEGLAKTLDAEPYRSQRQAIQKEIQEKIEQVTGPLEEDLKTDGMTLVSMQQGGMATTVIFPMIDDQPVSPEKLQEAIRSGEAPQEQWDAYEEALPRYTERLQETSRKVTELVQEVARKIRELNESIIRSLLTRSIAPILKTYPDPKVRKFLDDLINDVVEQRIHGIAHEGGTNKERYDVNIVLTHTDPTSRPVIEEGTPSLINLLGTVEPKWNASGVAISDHRGIRAGALLMADSGYLILDVNDLLSEPGAWRALMRTLRTERLEIVPPELGWMRQQIIMQPEPIPIQVRVILIGDMVTYYQLDRFDSDFRELFKVLADFDSELNRDATGIQQYAQVIAGLARTESFSPFDATAVAALVEHGARIVARQGKLTARFGRIADIAGEAAFLAGEQVVTGEHVKQAIQRTKARASLPSRKFRQMVENGTLMVQTSGQVVGQINGLAVMQSGPLTYGFPARITASIGPGSAGLIDIEGQAHLSGSIHTKGFHILRGLLRNLLKTQHPIAFSASLAFEQSYGGIDGDSASGAEIVCLLSALTNLPIDQSRAMTGAIDQHGHLEAIGGVNEKIEGFFDACNYFGLTGEQGVVIPRSNAGDLMLRDDVVAACRDGQFHVWAVETIYEAIELMTGRFVGKPDSQGKYPAGSLLAIAQKQVERFWRMTLMSPQSRPRGMETDLAAVGGADDVENDVVASNGEEEPKLPNA